MSKKVLLIAPTFFGYRDRVRDELVRQGNKVECINDRPSESNIFKSVAKASYSLVDRWISTYARTLRERVKNGCFDRVVVMGGMSFCLSREQLSSIMKLSDATFVAYLWDSLSNCQRMGLCLDLFDEVYSFEPADCKAYGLRLRPLFYSDVYTSLPLEPESGFEYDACFIGSVHQTSKFEAVKAVCDRLEARGMRVFKYFFMPSKSVEVFRKATNPTYRSVAFRYDPLPAREVASIYTRSRAVIDSPQSGQSGLTIRTLETLGARRKLITANGDVKNYDFFRYGNAFAIQGGNMPDETFFSTPYSELPRDIYETYSLRVFVKTLLGEAPEYHGYKKEYK